MRVYFLLLIFISCNATAYSSNHYLGFGLGYTWTQAVFNDDIRILGATQEVPSYSSVKNTHLPWRLHYGTMFTKSYGIEVGIVNFGEIKFSKTLTTTDNITSKITSKSDRSANINSQGYYLQHVFKYALPFNVNAYLKAGLIFGATHYSETENLTIYSEDTGTIRTLQLNESSENFVDWYYSIGGNYQLQKDWLISLQLSQLSVNHKAEKESFSQWLTNTSIEYRF